MKKRASVITEAFNRNDPNFHTIAKQGVGPPARKKSSEDTRRIYKEDGKTLTTSIQESRNRWFEHFKLLLNQVSTTVTPVTSPKLQQYLPKQQLCNLKHDRIFTLRELRSALSKCKGARALGMDKVNIEMIKALKGENEKTFLMVINKIWEVSDAKSIPKLWKDCLICILHKSGSAKDCNNYRGLSLGSHCGKLIERMLQSRLEEVMEETSGILPESQSGFRKNRSTMDAILTS